MMVDRLTVGVLSDTHGHLYPEVQNALEGVDYIIHAGDVGSPEVLTGLRAIAPVTAVRGNCDYDAWAQMLPIHAEIELGSVRIIVGHIASHLRPILEAQEGSRNAGRFGVVITGHTHVPAIENRDGTLYLNPGSAGPRRFNRPRTVARLSIRPVRSVPSDGRARVDAEIVIVET